MNQSETPLYDALLNWKTMNPLSFHVPGHKNGTVFPEKAKQLYKTILSIDATELSGLDDLHEPKGAILRAERLTAALYGSFESYFLVGGTTAGNLAMILASCAEQETVFVQRNSHKSIMNGLEMANAKPVFLTPFIDEKANVAVGVTVETIKQAYAAHRDVKALIVTNPNYYGMTMDLQEIIEFAHEHEIVVLVDEAHGAHFGVGEPFPPSAVSLGADVVVQSAHKTLPAMTMGSYLHVNESFPYREKLKTYLAILQSSSPSYPIMASLDLARYYLAHFSESERLKTIQTIESFHRSLQHIDGLRIVSGDTHQYNQDPLKIVVQSTAGISGFRLQKQFEQQGVFTELADEENVLFVMPLLPFEHIDSDIKRIKQALRNETDRLNITSRKETFEYKTRFSSLALSYKDMANASTTLKTLHEAEGNVSAEAIIPYPPGIPLVMKGEVISRESLDMIDRLLAIGARFQGGTNIKEKQLLTFV